MRASRTPMAILAAWLATSVVLSGCAHPWTVGPAQPPEPTRSGTPNSASAEREKQPPPLIHDTANPPMAQSPQGALGKGGARKIQEALVAHGFTLEKTGLLDGATQKAILAFQKSEDLAETGMPDLLMITRLGLDPQEILNTGD